MDRQSGIREVSGSAKNGRRATRSNYDHSKNVYGGGIGKQQGVLHNDQGTASRYFQQLPAEAPASVVIGNGGNAPFYYAAKASSKERNAGCEALPLGEPPRSARSNPAPGRQSALGQPRTNSHPTVKSQALCRHLLRTIVPENGIVLDCFAGSGSTLVAAIQENLHFIGIEQLDTEQEPYVTIARSRIADALQKRAEALQETPEGALRNTNQKVTFTHPKTR